jgi:hypothetical protein
VNHLSFSEQKRKQRTNKFALEGRRGWGRALRALQSCTASVVEKKSFPTFSTLRNGLTMQFERSNEHEIVQHGKSFV